MLAVESSLERILNMKTALIIAFPYTYHRYARITPIKINCSFRFFLLTLSDMFSIIFTPEECKRY